MSENSALKDTVKGAEIITVADLHWWWFHPSRPKSALKDAVKWAEDFIVDISTLIKVF